MVRKLINLLIILLIISPIATTAQGEPQIYPIIGDQVIVGVGIDGDDAIIVAQITGKNGSVQITADEETEFIITTGKDSQIYLSGEAIESLIKLTIQNEISKLKEELYNDVAKLYYRNASVITKIGSHEYTINGLPINFDEPTAFRINDGSTVMSVGLLRELGFMTSYRLAEDILIAEISYFNKTITVKQNSNIMTIRSGADLTDIEMSTTPIIGEHHLYLPTREVSKNFNLEIIWVKEIDGIILQHSLQN